MKDESRQPGQLVELASRLFGAAGTPAETANVVATSLVQSNLMGLDSHGVIKVPVYLEKIRKKELLPESHPEIYQEAGGTATVDAGWGYGQTAGRFAARLVTRLARDHGVATVAISRCNHVGRAGEYVESIARDGMIGFAVCSGANPGGNAAPYGGARRLMGTNPMAWGIPRGQGSAPIISDFATSAIAAGKLDVYLDEKSQAPPDTLIDAQGRQSRDPKVFSQGGALLPFGRQKGYALMLMIEIIATTFTGFAPAASSEYVPGNPMVLTAWNPDFFADRDRYNRLVEELVANIHSTPAGDGFEEVLLPGELEQRVFARRSKSGIPLAAATWEHLCAAAEEAGVEVPEAN